MANIQIRDGAATDKYLKASGAGSDVDPFIPQQTQTLLAGEAHIGEVGGRTRTVTATLTRPSNTDAYTAGDAVTDSTSTPTVLTFSNAVRTAAGSGAIIGATLIDSANQATKGSFELWLFDATYTPDNDADPFTPSDAELLTLIGIIPFTTAYVGDATSGAGGNAVYLASNLTMGFSLPSGTSLFGRMVVRNAYTPVSGEIFTVRLRILQD